jgi:hypothetical protein
VLRAKCHRMLAQGIIFVYKPEKPVNYFAAGMLFIHALIV